MEQIFNKIWVFYPNKASKKLSLAKFKKNFAELSLFAKSNNISIPKVVENWCWSWLSQNEFIDRDGKVIKEKVRYVKQFHSWCHNARWEDELYSDQHGNVIKGYFDVDTKKWLRVQKKIEPVVLTPERIQSLADYKKSVPQSALKYHKKNVAENNNMAEKSKEWLERKGVAV